MTNRQLTTLENERIRVGAINLPDRVETIEDLIDVRNKIDEALKKAKANMVDSLIKNGEKKLETEDFSISTWTETRVSCPDVSEVKKAYTKLVPIENIVVENGKYFQLQGNTELVKNELELGKEAPKGFNVKTIQKASLKIAGKTV